MLTKAVLLECLVLWTCEIKGDSIGFTSIRKMS